MATATAYRRLFPSALLRSSNNVICFRIRYITSDSKNVPDGDEALRRPKSVSVSTAAQLLRDGYAFLDVRTPDEFKAGHPSGATNIAYMLQTDSGKLKKNPQFEQQVLSSFTKDHQIIIGCRSGKRSLMAATDLTSLGFRNVVDLAGGYIAWRQHGLPVHKPE